MRPLRSLATLVSRDFLSTLRRPAFLATAVVYGLVVLLLAWSVGHAAPPEDGSGGGGLLWHRSVDGALAVIALGVVPLLLPLLVIGVGHNAISVDRQRGFLQILLARSVPRWRGAVSKLVGSLAALAIPAVLVSLAAAALVQGIRGADLDSRFLPGFVLATLLLTALYLVTLLILDAVLPSGLTLGLSLGLWLGSQVASPVAFLVGGQYLLVVPTRVVPVYAGTWLDLLSYTGMYEGFMALFIPTQLAFTTWPSLANWPALMVFWATVLVALALIPILCALYALMYQRLEVI